MFNANKTLIIFVSILIAFEVNGQEHIISENIDSKKFDPSTLLWYDQPAARWEDGVAVGNGRLGAMIFGNTNEERIQLNEDTYWPEALFNGCKRRL